VSHLRLSASCDSFCCPHYSVFRYGVCHLYIGLEKLGHLLVCEGRGDGKMSFSVAGKPFQDGLYGVCVSNIAPHCTTLQHTLEQATTHCAAKFARTCLLYVQPSVATTGSTNSAFVMGQKNFHSAKPSSCEPAWLTAASSRRVPISELQISNRLNYNSSPLATL